MSACDRMWDIVNCKHNTVFAEAATVSAPAPAEVYGIFNNNNALDENTWDVSGGGGNGDDMRSLKRIFCTCFHIIVVPYRFHERQ